MAHGLHAAHEVHVCEPHAFLHISLSYLLINIPREAKKLHRFIFAIALLLHPL